tara:strand:- start:43 stop:876 length:834 start_codon:yes stop_codon:yes gene_type:complete
MKINFFPKILIFIFLLIIPNYSNALKIDSYKIGDVVSDYLEITKNKKIKLSKGEWEVLDKSSDVFSGLKFSCLALIQTDKIEIQRGIEICFSMLSGNYITYVDHALIEVMFKDPYDGCYERPEYYLLEFYRKGSTHNCFIVRHIDVMKELYKPDKPEDSQYSATIKEWMRQNPEIKVPPIMLSSMHWYFSRLVNGYWIGLNYTVNPKLLNAPKNSYLTEETSEYHKYNIDKFPEHKKIMNQWISISAQRHIEFEKIFKSKSRHRLKLDKYILKKNEN